jgi:N-acetyl-gamma-glutamyl-phosphate reductase
MIVEIPLQLWALPTEPEIVDIHAILADAYRNEPFVTVASLQDSDAMASLAAQEFANTNQLVIRVFGDVAAQQMRLVASLDNLGKGASGAAVQNLNLVLGLNETEGLL